MRGVFPLDFPFLSRKVPIYGTFVALSAATARKTNTRLVAISTGKKIRFSSHVTIAANAILLVCF
jgi:hypothetical protein